MLRLTELEVHGGDLLLGLDARRANHRVFDTDLEGSWLLSATDGPTYRVEVRGRSVESRPVDEGSHAQATIEGSSRDLLALLLGRPGSEPLRLCGDVAFARRFADAFPGP